MGNLRPGNANPNGGFFQIHLRQNSAVRMSVLWFYEIPTWELGAIIVGLFCTLASVGLPFSRSWLARRISEAEEARHNSLIGSYLSAIGVFYGLIVGLIAVDAWRNLERLQSLVNREAAAVARLYRDSIGYPTEFRTRVRELLREYTDCVINKEWPAQKKGEVVTAGSLVVGKFVATCTSFEPRSEGQKIVHAEFFKILNELQELRRQRIAAVSGRIPLAVWAVVWIGALVLVALTYLFWMKDVWLHLRLNLSLSGMIGLLVFLVVAMDHPFWGEVCVRSDPFLDMVKHVMSQ
jgi:hypothetical protein